MTKIKDVELGCAALLPNGQCWLRVDETSFREVQTQVDQNSNGTAGGSTFTDKLNPSEDWLQLDCTEVQESTWWRLVSDRS